MRNSLPAKLRITAAALGCSARKDLCARFRVANPATEFDLERSHKWMQGRAAPRSSRVYDDWAVVIGTSRPGAWIAACTVDAFIEEVVRLFDADEGVLRHLAKDVPGAVPASRRIMAEGGTATLAFACYSPAWSPYFRGHLLRGSLRLTTGRGDERRLTYRERIGGEQYEFEGTAGGAGRTMNVLLRGQRDGFPLFFCVYQPGTPASALAGVMAGCTYLAQEARPTTCRFAAVQVPDGPALDDGNRYFEPLPGTVAEDLAMLGLPAAATAEAEAAVLSLLREGAAIDQVELAEQSRIAEAVDRGWILQDQARREPA